MAHEIMEQDKVVVVKEQAWHRLGIVIPEGISPTESLAITGMDFTVEQVPLYAQFEGAQRLVDSHVLNVRSDSKSELGVVGAGYCPVNYSTVAQFAEELAEQDDQIKIESAGTIRNGAKGWFLLKGESFSVRGDENIPYICVSAGHDGMTGVRATPTTVRVVCSNTLHMVIPSKDGKHIKQAGFAFHHTGDVMTRVGEAKKALRLYRHSLEETRAIIDSIAAKEIKSREDVQKFFLECYTHDFGAIPVTMLTRAEENARERAMTACNAVFAKFDEEKAIGGANYWSLLNAYTGWMQNDRKSRTKDSFAAAESKMNSKLFGVAATMTHHALQMALAA